MKRKMAAKGSKHKPEPREIMAIPSGPEIKKAREDRGISVLALSKKAKVPRQSIVDWESGKRTPRYSTVWRVMQCLSQLPGLPDIGLGGEPSKE